MSARARHAAAERFVGIALEQAVEGARKLAARAYARASWQAHDVLQFGSEGA